MISESKAHITKRVLLFFLFTFFSSALFLIPVLFFKKDYNSFPWSLLTMAANGTPSVIGIIFILRFKTYDKKTFIRISLSFKNIGLKYLLIAIFIMPFIFLMSYLINLLLFNDNPGFSGLSAIILNPTIFGSYLLPIVAAPIFEEFGWRGFALHELKNRFGVFKSSIIIGLVWALWHYPNPRNGINIFSTDCLIFTINIVLLSVIISLLYERSRESILTAIIIHSMHNLMKMLMLPFSTSMTVIYLIVMFLVSFFLFVVNREKIGQFKAEERKGNIKFVSSEDVLKR